MLSLEHSLFFRKYYILHSLKIKLFLHYTFATYKQIFNFENIESALNLYSHPSLWELTKSMKLSERQFDVIHPFKNMRQSVTVIKVCKWEGQSKSSSGLQFHMSLT